MELLISIILAFVALKLFSAVWNSPERIGVRGERRVAETLQSKLPPEYHVINDIYLPLPDGTTTQIDHVVVSRYGIFVIETKTYSGWIFGDPKSNQWTQTIYRKKSRFQNPLRQNYRHKCALADCLGIPRNLFMNLVVFNRNCEFKTEMPPEVVRRRHAPKYIMGFSEVRLKDKEVSDIVSAISEWTATIDESRKSAHVSNLRKRHSVVSIKDVAPKCPYCGKPMVLRKSRKNGNQFYGCSAYPNCKGIVNISN